MKPLPDLDDDAAMVLRGKRSAIGSARNDAAEALRNACVAVQGADWSALHAAADKAARAAFQLQTLAAIWNEL